MWPDGGIGARDHVIACARLDRLFGEDTAPVPCTRTAMEQAEHVPRDMGEPATGHDMPLRMCPHRVDERIMIRFTGGPRIHGRVEREKHGRIVISRASEHDPVDVVDLFKRVNRRLKTTVDADESIWKSRFNRWTLS